MFIPVVEDGSNEVEGFSYTNINGNVEKVHLNTGLSYVTLTDIGENDFDVYKEDIPKLIKALQAAYNHVNNG